MTCFVAELDEDTVQGVLKYFVIHTKHHEFNFPAHSMMPGIPKKVLMGLIRIIVLITSAFTLMEFLWGLCLLIKQSTNQRGKSNYFLD